MARGHGGRRKGAPGKSYSNRSDLNVNREAQPGSSAAPAPAPAQQPRPFIRPDDIPTLDTPTMKPQEPLTAGLSTGPGSGPPPDTPIAQRPVYDPLRAALRRDPSNYALRRVAAYLEMRNG